MRLRRHLTTISLALVAVATWTIVTPATALTRDNTTTPSDNGTSSADIARWGISPGPADNGTERADFQLTLDPGATAVDVVSVTNLSGQALTFDLYAADGVITSDGDPGLVSRDTPVEDLGAWIGFDSATVKVPADGRLGIPFRVSVPPDATPGDHCGGILASPQIAALEVDATGFKLDARTAVWICVTVPGDIVSALDISAITSVYHAKYGGFGLGDVVVTAVVKNTGNLRQSGQAQLRVAGPFGWWSRQANVVAIPELTPGQSYTTTLTLTAVPPIVSALVTAQITPEAREGFPDGPAVSTDKRVWLAPWVAAIIAAALAFLIWRRVTARRRRKRLVEREVATRLATRRLIPRG